MIPQDEDLRMEVGGESLAVLIVEDETDDAVLMARALNRQGILVATAPTSEDAVEALRKGKFDAILLDYHLPGNRWQVLEEAQRRVPPLPVALMTGAGNEAIAADGINRGIAAYVKKGPDFWTLLPQTVEHLARLSRAERERLSRDTFYSLVSENASDIVVRVNEEGVVTRVSRACEHILGFSAEELVGREGKFKVHPDDIQATLVALSRRTSSSVLRSLFRVQHKNGSYRWIEAHGRVTRAADGHPLELVSIGRDVTSRKEIEERLVAESRRLAEAQKIAHIGSWEWEIGPNVVTWSDELFRIYGLTPEGFRNSYEAYKAAVHPDDRTKVEQNVMQTVTTGTPFDYEHRIVRPNGEVRVLRARGEIISAADGRPLRMAGIAQDITEQRAMEESLAQGAAELKRSNAELESFAYAASHDLRSPLSAIATLSTWIAEDAGPRLGPESSAHLELIRKRVQRMDRLLSDILAYSRAGRVSDPIETFDLDELLAEVAELCQKTGFTVGLPKGLPRLHGHRVALKRVLLNLVSNAIKHHDRPEGTVRVLGTLLPDTDKITLEVEDDGPGIPERSHQQIFLMFTTLRPKDEVEGSGMGLAMVKRLVELEGGTIEVRPARKDGDRGTVFSFTWPVAPTVA